MVLGFACESDGISSHVRLGISNPSEVRTAATALGHLRTSSQWRGDSVLTTAHKPINNLLHPPTMLALRCRDQLLAKSDFDFRPWAWQRDISRHWVHLELLLRGLFVFTIQGASIENFYFSLLSLGPLSRRVYRKNSPRSTQLHFHPPTAVYDGGRRRLSTSIVYSSCYLGSWRLCPLGLSLILSIVLLTLTTWFKLDFTSSSSFAKSTVP